MQRALFITFFFSALYTLSLAQDVEYMEEVVLKCDFETNCIAINKESNQLLIGGQNKSVTLYDLNTRKILFETQAHYQQVVEVHFSNKHNGFYTVGDKSFKLWINHTEKPEKIYKGSHTSITDWDISENEDFFIGGSYEKRFRCWTETNLDKPETVTTTHKKSVISIALSKNKKLIASGSLDNTIKLWSTDSLKKIRSIDAHSKPVCCLYFLDDKYLLSGSHDGLVFLWNVNTGERKVIYDGHTKAISDIAINPDGKHLLTASYDNTIALYNIASGDRIYRYKYHESAVQDVIWNASGDGFYSCDKDGKIVRWSVPSKVFVEHYFGAEINKETLNKPLFKAKQKGESKNEYKARKAKADIALQKIVDSYYQEYLKLLETNNLEN